MVRKIWSRLSTSNLSEKVYPLEVLPLVRATRAIAPCASSLSKLPKILLFTTFSMFLAHGAMARVAQNSSFSGLHNDF